MVALILLRECYLMICEEETVAPRLCTDFYEWIETFFTALAEIIFDMERDAIYTRLDIVS
jgi:hypothetical protein